jgi:hypothetical protein
MAFLKSLTSMPKNLLVKKVKAGDKQEKKSNLNSESDKSAGSLSLKGDEPKSIRAFFSDFLIRSSHEQAKQVQSQEEQADIDKWLESIRNKSTTAATTRKSTSKSTASRAKSTKAKPAARKSKGK